MQAVAPLAGAWIEIQKLAKFCTIYWVAPLAGAWIEIRCNLRISGRSRSLPSRERGLKLDNTRWDSVGKLSLPSRERGLKS